MKIIQLTKDAFYMGDMDPTYGYTVLGDTAEGKVMFNTKQQNILAGTTLVAQDFSNEIFKTGKNVGKSYIRLRKVTIGDSNEDSGTAIDNQPVAPSIDSKLDAILGEIRMNNSMLRGLQKRYDTDNVVDVDGSVTEMDYPDVP